MTAIADTIVRWIDEDRKELISSLSQFVRIPSANPRGDTRLGYSCSISTRRAAPRNRR